MTLFSIGIVSTRVGLHQQTLREYERQGLVVPQRTPKGTRRYSEEDIELLVRVQQLTAEGMSLQAAGYVLSLEAKLRRANERIRELEEHARAAGDGLARRTSFALVRVNKQ